MKNVLIIDAPPMFREFLKDKLVEEKIGVSFTLNKRDALSKIDSIIPELVVIDINEADGFEFLLEFFKKIKEDPNASKIPMIACGPKMDRSKIEIFAKYGVLKYFVKPIKFDLFFEAIGSILRTAFSMDNTPCLLDIHRKDNIIFIEIAQGLNREKLSLLKYRLSEIIETEKIEGPKVLLMMTNLELTFVDGLNLELLLSNIISTPKVLVKNVKVLSFNNFTRQLITGHPEYAGIEMVNNISDVLDSIVKTSDISHIPDLITDKILSQDEGDEISMETRFSDDKLYDTPAACSLKPKIAIVDDDTVILRILESAFKNAGIECFVYSSGTNFLSDISKNRYDLIILDILMPGLSGFDTLKRLYRLAYKPPVLIYSQAVQKEMILQALSLGAKHYLVKPQKPEIIIQKAIELLNVKI